jgi:ring-1,2-phenylacetyl-CoA epoxidase subunit PaaE
MSGLHFHPLRVNAVQRDTEDALIVSFELPAALRETFVFAAGQYLTLRRPGHDVRRSYSICAAPGEPLRVGVRHVPGGVFSSWVHSELKAGDTLEVMQPQGRFGAALTKHISTQAEPHTRLRPRHILAVAGGSGITPLLSILKAALAGESQTRCTLLYGNRQAASALFKEELEDLKNRYFTRLAMHWVFSREHMDSPLSSGRLDAEKIAALLRLNGGAAGVDEAFICGPHALNDEAQAALLACGVAPERIHVERFGIPPSAADATLHAPRPGDAVTARIEIIRDGVMREVGFTAADESILAAAARTGMDLPFSCKSGVCATCRAKVVHGQVRMDRNFALEKEDLAAGFVLTCQAHPLTERVRVSFDER